MRVYNKSIVVIILSSLTSSLSVGIIISSILSERLNCIWFAIIPLYVFILLCIKFKKLLEEHRNEIRHNY